MANKKLLICAALATGLLLTACVKKEEPKNEEQSEQASEAQTTQAASQPQQNQEFQPLESVDKPATPAPVIEMSREETPNTTTEIRRETRPAQTAEETTTAQAELLAVLSTPLVSIWFPASVLISDALPRITVG